MVRQENSLIDQGKPFGFSSTQMEPLFHYKFISYVLKSSSFPSMKYEFAYDNTNFFIIRITNLCRDHLFNKPLHQLFQSLKFSFET